MEVLKVYKGKKAQGLLAHATLGPKSYKSLKLKLSDFIFLKQMSSGSPRILEKPWTDSTMGQKVQDSFGFSFPKSSFYII